MNPVFMKAASVFKDCAFPLYIYQPKSDEFCQVSSGDAIPTPAPSNMMNYLKDENTFFQSFRKGDSLMTFYFLRITLEGTNIVIMVNSDQNRIRLNSVMTAIGNTLEEESESVTILRRSRGKMLKLLDGLTMPLFSVSPDYDIRNVNKELAQFIGVDDIPSIMKKKCYEAIHGRSEPCEFCRMADIKNGDYVGGQNISLDKNGKQIKVEHHMFPIFDNTGEMNEVGEFMIDITENLKLLDSVKDYKIQARHSQKFAVDKMNKMDELKKAYKELLKNNDEALTKNRKMTKALEKILVADNVNEMISLRQENKEVKNKLARSATALKNFQISLADQEKRYEQLSKKAVYQLERLINTINKKNMLGGEALTYLKMVSDDVKDLRKTLKITPPPREE